MTDGIAKEIARLWAHDMPVASPNVLHECMIRARYLEPDGTGGYRVSPVALSALGVYLLEDYSNQNKLGRPPRDADNEHQRP